MQPLFFCLCYDAFIIEGRSVDRTHCFLICCKITKNVNLELLCGAICSIRGPIICKTTLACSLSVEPLDSCTNPFVCNLWCHKGCWLDLYVQSTTHLVASACVNLLPLSIFDTVGLFSALAFTWMHCKYSLQLVVWLRLFASSARQTERDEGTQHSQEVKRSCRRSLLS